MRTLFPTTSNPQKPHHCSKRKASRYGAQQDPKAGTFALWDLGRDRQESDALAWSDDLAIFIADNEPVAPSGLFSHYLCTMESRFAVVFEVVGWRAEACRRLMTTRLFSESFILRLTAISRVGVSVGLGVGAAFCACGVAC